MPQSIRPSPLGSSSTSQQHQNYETSRKRNSWIFNLFLESDSLILEYFKCLSPHQAAQPCTQEGGNAELDSEIDLVNPRKWTDTVLYSISSPVGQTQGSKNYFAVSNASHPPLTMEGDTGALDIGLFEEASDRRDYESPHLDPRYHVDFR